MARCCAVDDGCRRRVGYAGTRGAVSTISKASMVAGCAIALMVVLVRSGLNEVAMSVVDFTMADNAEFARCCDSALWTGILEFIPSKAKSRRYYSGRLSAIITVATLASISC
jgi:hypothetical protein